MDVLAIELDAMDEVPEEFWLVFVAVEIDEELEVLLCRPWKQLEEPMRNLAFDDHARSGVLGLPVIIFVESRKVVPAVGLRDGTVRTIDQGLCLDDDRTMG